MVNMLLNIKIAFLFFVLDIYMMNMGGLVFLMPDGYDVFFLWKIIRTIRINAFFCDTKKDFIFIQTEAISSTKFEALSHVYSS